MFFPKFKCCLDLSIYHSKDNLKYHLTKKCFTLVRITNGLFLQVEDL